MRVHASLIVLVLAAGQAALAGAQATDNPGIDMDGCLGPRPAIRAAR